MSPRAGVPAPVLATWLALLPLGCDRTEPVEPEPASEPQPSLAAAGSFELTLTTTPETVEAADPIQLQLALRNTSDSARWLPPDLEAQLSVSAKSRLVGQRIPVATARALVTATPDETWTQLAAGETRTLTIAVGDHVSTCKDGCGAGAHALTFWIVGVQEGDAPEARWEFQIGPLATHVEEGLSAVDSTARWASDEAVELRATVRNDTDAPMAIPREDWITFCDAEVTYRGETTGMATGGGGFGPRPVPLEALVVLQPGQTHEVHERCSLERTKGKFVVKPRMGAMVVLDPSIRGELEFDRLFTGWVRLPDTPVSK